MGDVSECVCLVLRWMLCILKEEGGRNKGQFLVYFAYHSQGPHVLAAEGSSQPHSVMLHLCHAVSSHRAGCGAAACGMECRAGKQLPCPQEPAGDLCSWLPAPSCPPRQEPLAGALEMLPPSQAV